jgi:hypothetical protein
VHCGAILLGQAAYAVSPPVPAHGGAVAAAPVVRIDELKDR